jgi:hypothetical protein
MDSSSLKVDATCLLFDQAESGALYICNINIPTQYFNDPDVWERVLNFIDTEFQDHNPSYEICGTYFLKHKETEEEKFWAGSFFSHRNTVGGRLPDLFKPYNREELEAQLRRLDEIAASWAYLGGEDTAWDFHGAVSAIINVNCSVQLNSRNIANRGFTNFLGHVRRKHVTFPLP